MTIKTYSIHGLSEWYGDVKAGTLSVKVAFTGGTASPSVAVPAYFMTKDPVVQFVIEHSKEFKSGFIRLNMQQTIAGDHPRMATHKPDPATDVAGSGKPESNEPEEGPAVSEENANEGNTAEEVAAPDGKRTVKVADKAEAIEWLKENYPDKGYTAVKLRSTAAFETACQECNVVFEF